MVFRGSVGDEISLTYEDNESLRDPRNIINELQTALSSVRHARFHQVIDHPFLRFVVDTDWILKIDFFLFLHIWLNHTCCINPLCSKMYQNLTYDICVHLPTLKLIQPERN